MTNQFLDIPERHLYKQVFELQNAKIDALRAEINALKSLVNQHPSDPAVADEDGFSAGHIGKRLCIPSVTLESGSPVLFLLQKLIDDARTELIAHPHYAKDAHELNGLILDALPQWFKLSLQHHTKLSQTQLLDLSFDEFCNRLLELGLEMDHQGRYATFFQRHGSVRAAIMAGSSLNRAWVGTRAPGGPREHGGDSASDPSMAS